MSCFSQLIQYHLVEGNLSINLFTDIQVLQTFLIFIVDIFVSQYSARDEVYVPTLTIRQVVEVDCIGKTVNNRKYFLYTYPKLKMFRYLG